MCTQKPSFLSLPIEVRLAIYHELCTGNYIDFMFPSGRATWDCDLRPLNICCRQLRQETSPLLYQNITVLALYGMTDDDYFCIPRHVRECVTDFEDSLPHQPELNCVPDVFPNLKRMHFSLDPGWTCRPLIKEGVFDDVDFEKFKLGIWGQLWKPMDYGGVIESYDDIFTEQSLAFADQYLNRDLFKNTRPGTIELILHRRMAFKTDHKQRLPVFNVSETKLMISSVYYHQE